MRHQNMHRTCNDVKADQPQDGPEDQDDDPIGELIDLIVADARPLTSGQWEALRRRILGGGAR
jgi:hypothetical protein